MKPETKFYAQVKRNLTKISWIRIENLSVPGTPDLLGYNNNGVFFTVELKYLLFRGKNHFCAEITFFKESHLKFGFSQKKFLKF